MPKRNYVVDAFVCAVIIIFILVNVPTVFCNNAANKQKNDELSVGYYEKKLQKAQADDNAAAAQENEILSSLRAEINYIEQSVFFFTKIEESLKEYKKQYKNFNRNKEEIIKDIEELYDLLIKDKQERVKMLNRSKAQIEWFLQFIKNFKNFYKMNVLHFENELCLAKVIEGLSNENKYLRRQLDFLRHNRNR